MVNFTTTCELTSQYGVVIRGTGSYHVVVVSLSYYYPFVVCLAGSPIRVHRLFYEFSLPPLKLTDILGQARLICGGELARRL